MDRLEKIKATKALRQAQLGKAPDTPAVQPKTPEELFNITLEAVKDPYPALFTPAELMKKGMTSEEANAIHTFLSAWGFIDDNTNMLRSSATPNELEKFKYVFESYMNTAHSTTANEKSAVTSVFPNNNTATDVLANLGASTGRTPGSGSTTEGVSFEIEAAPQTDFAHTPLGEAYIAHSTALKNNYPATFKREQGLITWMIENKESLEKEDLLRSIRYHASAMEDSDQVIIRLKQRGIILEDTEKKTLYLSPSLSNEGARAKIYLAIHNVDDPSVTPAAKIFKSVDILLGDTTPAAAPASPDVAPEITVENISNLIGSNSREEAEAILQKHFSAQITDLILGRIYVHTDLWDRDKKLITVGNTLLKEFQRLDPEGKEAFINALNAIQNRVGRSQTTLDTSAASTAAPSAEPIFTLPESSPAAPDNFELSDEKIAAAPEDNPATSLDKKRQRIESVTRLFSALKGSAQKSPSRVAGAIASCFLVLGVGTVMYSGKEKAPEVKPAAETPADKATGGAVRQGEQQEAVKAPANAYKNAELYRGLDSKKQETVDRLMTSTAEQFMMPYLNTVTIYQNSRPTTIRLNEASKKTLFKEMNTDWNTLVANSFSRGPGDPQGADGITLTDTAGKMYNQVYVRVDEQVAKAFKDIRDVTVVVLKKQPKEPYPEGKLENIYDTIKAEVTQKLN